VPDNPPGARAFNAFQAANAEDIMELLGVAAILAGINTATKPRDVMEELFRAWPGGEEEREWRHMIVDTAGRLETDPTLVDDLLDVARRCNEAMS
jgi:signal recognition particle GTPase